jgi:diacylglycerol kinase family enzyme
MEDVLVGNTEYHNGGMRLTPGALPDDGLFDVLLIGDVTKRDLALNLHKLYRGTFLPHPRAELLRGSTVTVESASPLPIELDGEQPGTTPARFEVVPRALRVRVPSSGS